LYTTRDRERERVDLGDLSRKSIEEEEEKVVPFNFVIKFLL